MGPDIDIQDGTEITNVIASVIIDTDETDLLLQELEDYDNIEIITDNDFGDHNLDLHVKETDATITYYFSSDKIVIKGVDHIDCYKTFEEFNKSVTECHYCKDDDLLPKVNIHNIVATHTYDVVNVDLPKLKLYNMDVARYDAEIFTACIISPSDTVWSANVYESGKAVITGCESFTQLNEVIDMVDDMISEIK